MRLNSRIKFREFLDTALWDLSHPLWLISAFLLSPFKLANSRTIMFVHIVNGMGGLKWYAILATFGIIIISISFYLYNRFPNSFGAIMNVLGCFSIMAAFKIAQLKDETVFNIRDIYNGVTATGFVISAALFLAYNFPQMFKRFDVKQFVQEIWRDEERERLN